MHHRERNFHHHKTSPHTLTLHIGAAESEQSAEDKHVVTAVAVAAMILSESGTVNNITMDSATGAVDTHVPLYSPFDTGSSKSRQHHISLITDKREQFVNAQVTLAQHVEHAAWRADHNVLSVTKLVDVVTHRCSANVRMARHVEVVAKCQSPPCGSCWANSRVGARISA